MSRAPIQVTGAIDAEVAGNAADLALALAELLDNAADASAQVARVDVEAGPDSVRFVVEDCGPGMTPELLGRVGEPWFSTKGRAGLGLATVVDIADRNDGRLVIDSRPGRGTRAVLTLKGHAVEALPTE